MDSYNYIKEITNDILNWLEENEFDLSNFDNREDAESFLNDELWAEDDITGNLTSYDSEEKCEEYLCHNIELIFDACEDFCIDVEQLRTQYKKGFLARYLDSAVRCYLLSEAIFLALNKYEVQGHKYKENE